MFKHIREPERSSWKKYSHVPYCFQPCQLYLLHPHAEVFLLWVWKNWILWVTTVECDQPCYPPSLHLLPVPLLRGLGRYLELCLQASRVEGTNSQSIIDCLMLFINKNNSFSTWNKTLLLFSYKLIMCLAYYALTLKDW